MTRAEGLGGLMLSLVDAAALFREATGNEPLAWQPDYLREERNAVILKGRQVGASTCAGVKAIRRARLLPGFTAGIVSPSLNQSKEVKERATRALERLGARLVGDSASALEMENGSRIISLPGSKKSVRGWTFDLLVIDEAAYLDPGTFLAARATAATGGQVIVQSTPAGPYGHFYDLWEHPDEGWAKFHVSSEDVPTIAASFLAKEREDLTEDEYAQEYLGRFSAPGMGLVDPERLRALVAEAGAGDDFWERLQ